jgi:hypothetical protein
MTEAVAARNFDASTVRRFDTYRPKESEAIGGILPALLPAWGGRGALAVADRRQPRRQDRVPGNFALWLVYFADEGQWR